MRPLARFGSNCRQGGTVFPSARFGSNCRQGGTVFPSPSRERGNSAREVGPMAGGGSTCPRNVLTALIRRFAATSHEGTNVRPQSAPLLDASCALANGSNACRQATSRSRKLRSACELGLRNMRAALSLIELSSLFRHPIHNLDTQGQSHPHSRSIRTVLLPGPNKAQSPRRGGNQYSLSSTRRPRGSRSGPGTLRAAGPGLTAPGGAARSYQDQAVARRRAIPGASDPRREFVGKDRTAHRGVVQPDGNSPDPQTKPRGPVGVDPPSRRPTRSKGPQR